MRLIRLTFLLLTLILTAGVALAQEGGSSPRLTDSYTLGEFESASSMTKLWTLKNYAVRDRRVCGDLGFNGSNCAIQFYGNTDEATRLTRLAYPDRFYGDPQPHYGYLIARIKPVQGEISLQFSFTFSFYDGSPDVTTSYIYTGTGPSADYQSIYFESAAAFNPRTISSSRVTVVNRSSFRSIVLVDTIMAGMTILPAETR